ncbi:MAG: twin-arginine translocase subunit TatC [Thermodesulfobacteriota bacterium]
MSESVADTASQQEAPDEGRMGLIEHLNDMRRSIVRSVVAAFVGMLACYAFKEQLFDYLMLPLYQALPEESTLIYTAPHEAFFTYIKVAFVAGLFLASPYIFYQVWSFVAPGLYKHERKWLIPIAVFCALFFCCGAIFGYAVVFPWGYKFFMGFAEDLIRPMLTMRESFAFAMRLLIAFGVVFELPLVIFFLARLGLVSAAGLRQKRKYALLIAFIVSALLTPPDLVTQTFMAGPLALLYELSIWVAVVFGKKRPSADDGAEADTDTSETAHEKSESASDPEASATAHEDEMHQEDQTETKAEKRKEDGDAPDEH